MGSNESLLILDIRLHILVATVCTVWKDTKVMLNGLLGCTIFKKLFNFTDWEFLFVLYSMRWGSYIFTLWTSPLDKGETKWRKHDMAPADSPMMVTLLLSPPNLEMFSWIHFNANTWSCIPLNIWGHLINTSLGQRVKKSANHGLILYSDLFDARQLALECSKKRWIGVELRMYCVGNNYSIDCCTAQQVVF